MFGFLGHTSLLSQSSAATPDSCKVECKKIKIEIVQSTAGKRLRNETVSYLQGCNFIENREAGGRRANGNGDEWKHSRI